MVNSADTKKAVEDLELIKDAMIRAKEAMASGGAYYLILWGTIYIIGYLGSQFLADPIASKLWAVIVTLGVLASFFIGSILGSKTMSRAGLRVMFFWIFLLLYTPLWLWILKPVDASKASLFITTVAMFGFIVMGLWTDPRLLMTGLFITAVSVLVYHLFPAYIGLLMALLGGGTMVVVGLYILKNWKKDRGKT